MLHRPSFGRTNHHTDEKVEAVLREQQTLFEDTAQRWEQTSQDYTQKEVATAKTPIEQQTNDVFNELNVRVSQEANAMALLRGSLTQAQHDAQAETSALQAATKKTGKVESEAREFIAKQRTDLTKEGESVLSQLSAQGA